MTAQTPARCPATRHGDVYAYKTYGCRCPLAVAANSRAQKVYRLRVQQRQPLRVDATGTRRRLQALAAIGWRSADLAPMLGADCSETVWQLQRRRYVAPRTARAVADLYDRLWATPGPSSITRRRAERNRWPTPLELDDDRIDDPTYQPTLYRLTPAIARRQATEERWERVAELNGRGWDDQRIARHLGISDRTVFRIRKLTGLPAAVPSGREVAS